MKTVFVVALIFAVSGCNTFEGFGRDVAAGGQAIEQAAVSAQQPEQQPVYRPAPQPQAPVYSQPAPDTRYVY